MLTSRGVPRLKPGFHSNACNADTATKRTQRKRLHCMRCVHEKHKQATQASWLAAAVVHSYWLPLAFVAWKIESILLLRFLTQWPLASVAWLALAYFCFFACVIFLHLLRFLCSFYFACVIFLMQDLACVWMETGLKTTQPSRSKPSPPPHSPSPGWQILRPRLAFSSLVNQSVK